MSDTVVKSDDLSVDPEVVVAVPTKTIVPERDDPALVQLHDAGNGDDHAAYETREDDQNEDNIRDEHPDVTKREDIGEDRDRAANFDNNSSITGSSQQHKKKVTTTGTSSSPGATRTKNTSNAGSNKHQLQQHFQQQQMQLQQQNANGARYYSNNNNSNIPPNMPGSRGGPMFPMARGFGGPPPYGGYPGGNYGPPPPHYHPPPHAPPSHHPHMMPPHYNNGPYAGPSGGMKGNYHPSMAYGGPGPGPYGMAPYPPIHHGMNPTFQGSNMSLAQQPSDSNSISSKSSMNSKKKRTIEGLQHHPHSKLPTSYSFRRSDSNSSAASTATAGNNTSTETHHTEDSHHPRSHRHHQHHPKRSTSCEADLSTLRMGGSSGSSVLNGNNDRRHRTTIRAGQQKPHYHRRDYSGTSTASSLSVGGLSLSSYERGAHRLVTTYFM